MSELTLSQYDSDIGIQNKNQKIFPADLLAQVHAVNDPGIDKWVATITHNGKKEEFVANELHVARTDAAFRLYKSEQNDFIGFGEFSYE